MRRLRKKLSAIGLAGLLIGMPQVVSSQDQGLDNLREYGKMIFLEYSKSGKIPATFTRKIGDKEVSIFILGKFGLFDLSEDNKTYSIVMDVSDFLVQKTFFDAGMKGDLSGVEDSVNLVHKSKDSEEDVYFRGDGTYNIKRRVKVKKEDCKKHDAYFEFSGLCLNGKAFYSAKDGADPELTGFYGRMNHAELQDRGKKELKLSNKEYKKNLIEIIEILEEEGVF